MSEHSKTFNQNFKKTCRKTNKLTERHFHEMLNMNNRNRKHLSASYFNLVMKVKT